MTSTRKQVRRAVFKNLGDLIVCKATNNGTDDTFIDTLNLVGGLNHYKGRDVLFTGGTLGNLGQQRYVISSSRTQRGLGFEIALPAATMTGDELELVNTSSVGFKFQDIHDIINICIRMVSSDALVPAPNSESTYAQDVSIDIPDGYATVEYVYRADSCRPNVWRQVPKAPRPNGNGWSIDHAERTVVIGGRYACGYDGAIVRLTGLMEPCELYDDEDVTGLDFMWLVKQVGALAALAKHSRMPIPELERTMFIRNQEAGSLMPNVMTRRSPFSENV